LDEKTSRTDFGHTNRFIDGMALNYAISARVSDSYNPIDLFSRCFLFTHSDDASESDLPFEPLPKLLWSPYWCWYWCWAYRKLGKLISSILKSTVDPIYHSRRPRCCANTYLAESPNPPRPDPEVEGCLPAGAAHYQQTTYVC
jgi:hypothetical protein